MALLPRKIFFELITTMVLGLIGISLVMTIVLAMVEGVRHGMDPFSVLAVAPYMVPTMLPYTIPVCLLYSCVVVYGGMSGSNEIIAVKAAGVNVMRLVQPAIYLALATVALGFYITDRVIPNCNLRLREVLISDLENAVLTYLKNNNGRLSGDGSSYEIAVASVKDNRLIDPIIVRKNAQGETIANTKASEAILHVTQSPSPGEPPLINIKLIGAEVRIIKGQQGWVRLNDENFPMPVPEQLWKGTEKKLDCLSYRECYDRSRELVGKAHAHKAELAWRGAVALMNGQPAPYAKHLMQVDQQALQKQIDWQLRKSRDAIGEMHVRGNHSLAALSFVLLGCPISILLSRKDPLQTFFLCFAPIVVLYYPSVILTFNVFKEGIDDASFIWGQAMMWAPATGMLFAAISAMRRLVRT
jgi:lipopolysaccharide export system permease protein